MKVKSIAECLLSWSIMQYFWPALRDNGSWKPMFKTAFTEFNTSYTYDSGRPIKIVN